MKSKTELTEADLELIKSAKEAADRLHVDARAKLEPSPQQSPSSLKQRR